VSDLRYPQAVRAFDEAAPLRSAGALDHAVDVEDGEVGGGADCRNERARRAAAMLGLAAAHRESIALRCSA
jgi:hypothetical protein